MKREKGKKMKHSFMGRVTAIVSLFMILLFLLQGVLQFAMSRRHFAQSASISIDQIHGILERIDEGERSLTASLKDDYIIRAQACSYIVEHALASELDVPELRRVAQLLEVDEIHLFDLTGSIYAGTNPEYFGYNFDSGDQMRFFKPMLADRELSLCQDVTPNTAEGKLMMYALVWREDGKGLVQIGLTPTRLLEQIEKNKVSNILSEIPANDNIYFVADHATGEIITCTNDLYTGSALRDAGIDRARFTGDSAAVFSANLCGTASLAAFRVCGDYEIGVCQSVRDVYRGAYSSSLVVLGYLLFASASIVFLVGFMTRKNQQREQAHQAQLQKALLQANAASEAKSAFLANMSHDIRTPMNAIIGFTELLEKHADDPARRDDYIAKIKASEKYLLGLLNNVLEMARIEKGEMAVEESVLCVERLIDTLLSVFRADMDRKKLTFDQDIRVEHPCVLCDAAKVQEILLNLVGNAVKYTPAGGAVTLRLREAPGDAPGRALYTIEVEDTGIGISKAFLPRLFDEFARERNTTQSRIGGTGLGLPIAKKLAELMGGTIAVRSELGKGTLFTVTLPLRIADRQSVEHARGEERTEPAPDAFAGKRILLAEDNELNAEIATEILESAGLAVEWARDGALCVRMLTAAAPGHYDLILMDMQMPNMNGYEATKAIRALPGPPRDIPILAMTANAFAEDRQNALTAGMNDHIAKPIDAAKLLSALAPYLGQGG